MAITKAQQSATPIQLWVADTTAGSPFLTLNAALPAAVMARGLQPIGGVRAPPFPFEFQ